MKNEKINILVIDGQGGRIGRQITEDIKNSYPEAVVTAVGTNSIATAAMLKAGADHGATGENAVIVACRRADVIIGPIGIVIADALFGEVTPEMAKAVAQSSAKRILIPMDKCDTVIAGVAAMSTSEMLSDVMKKLGEIINA